ncbi:MAG: hypothetical protein ACM3XM_17090 [Mycobacterium leprae]
MNHPWKALMHQLADELDAAGIPYSFEAATALLLQGLAMPGMDDIDLAVQWDRLDDARRLFQEYNPGPVAYHPGWAIFRFERAGVPVDILSYEATVMADDPDRLAVIDEGRPLWCKSMAFFYRNSPPGHPRRRLIEEFWATQGPK